MMVLSLYGQKSCDDMLEKIRWMAKAHTVNIERGHLGNMRDHIRNRCANVYVRCGNRYIPALKAVTPSIELASINVQPLYQRKGYAKRLIEGLERMAGEEQRVFLVESVISTELAIYLRKRGVYIEFSHSGISSDFTYVAGVNPIKAT